MESQSLSLSSCSSVAHHKVQIGVECSLEPSNFSLSESERSPDLDEFGQPVQPEVSEAERQEASELESAQRVKAKLIAGYISRMAVVAPEVLRDTSAGLALRACGRPLRSSGAKDLFRRSRATKSIGTFWSHSWHGSNTTKILVLLLSYNGPAAAILGTLAAVIMFILSSYDLLPGAESVAIMQQGDSERRFEKAPWSHLSGCLVAALVLFLWPARSRVFVDRICIHQEQQELKSKGILSIGGFIKHSRSMLVLWDPTYVGRLWCVFELAAFLKSQEQEPGKWLRVRPTFMGPWVLAVYSSFAIGGLSHFVINSNAAVATILMVGGWLIFFSGVGHALRSHHRSIEHMLCQLQDFDIKNTESQCCITGHRDPVSETPVMCDREILLQCITGWFGSVENFEEEVRSKVSTALAKGLGNAGMPYLWGIGVVVPFVWTQLDGIAARLRAGEKVLALDMTIYTLAAWCGMVPLVLPLAFGLTKCFQRRRHYVICDWLVTIGVTACVVLQLVLLFMLYALATDATPHRLIGASIYAVTLAVAGFLTWTRFQNKLWNRPARENPPCNTEPGHSAISHC